MERSDPEIAKTIMTKNKVEGIILSFLVDIQPTNYTGIIISIVCFLEGQTHASMEKNRKKQKYSQLYDFKSKQDFRQM